MRNSILFILSLAIFSCQQPNNDFNDNQLQYSTQNDSTLFYYRKGWQQIMDEGRYGQSEVSYRKALRFDPDFLVGKAVLARLTLDIEERLQLYKELEEQKEDITGDERLLLDVYIGLTHFTNLREQGADNAREVLNEVLNLAFKNFGVVVRKYPEEIHLLAEYIEIIHSLKGGEASLDSLAAINPNHNNPFLLGYTASMQAELKNFDFALEKAKELESQFKDKTTPKPYAVFADVYFKMDRLELAKKYADKAFELDPRNLDAIRLKNRIDKRMQEE